MLLLVNGLESQMVHSCLEKLSWGLSTLCFVVRPSQLNKKVIVKRQKKEFFSIAPKGRKKAQVIPRSVFGIPAWGLGFSGEQAVSIAVPSWSGCGSTNKHHLGSSLFREVAQQGGRAVWSDQFLLWPVTDFTLPFSHYETPRKISMFWHLSLQ